MPPLHPEQVATNLLANGAGGARDWAAALARLRGEARSDPWRARALGLIEAMALTPEGDPVRAPRGSTLLESPHVTGFAKLFSAAECDYLVAAAEPRLAPSTVAGDDGDYPDPARTSDGAMFESRIEDPLVHALNRRIAAASGTQIDQAELLLVLRYLPGQEYRRHYDALPGLANQRILTMLVWLNQGYEGGETAFVRAGVQMKGSRGDAILFRNAGADGRPDPMSEHEGVQVRGGVKYLASRWIRARAWLPGEP